MTEIETRFGPDVAGISTRTNHNQMAVIEVQF